MVKKRFLPNYGVFDEIPLLRARATSLFLFEHGETLVGVTVCEDMWQPGPPATDLALAGAELIVNVSASPFHLCGPRARGDVPARARATTSCFVAFCNTVGGQDELIFDGHSLVIDDEGDGARARARLRGGAAHRRRRPDGGASRAGSRDVRRRALAHDRGDSAPVATIHVGAPHEQRDTLDAAVDPVLRRARADAARARARAARLRAQERLPRDRRRRLGRDRLGARRRARGRGARSRARALRLDAVALLVGGDARRRAAARREPRLRLPRDPDRADGRGVHRARSRRTSRAASPTSPRRTCRRGSAARC